MRKDFQTVSEEFFSETSGTEGSNLPHTYSAACISGVDFGVLERGVEELDHGYPHPI